MMDKNKSLKIQIFGDEYSLVSDESRDQIEQAATMVDSLMQEIAHKGVITNEKKIAVLGALRLASKLLQLESIRNSEKEKEQQIINQLDRALIEK